MITFIKEYQPCESLKPFVELYWEGSFNPNGSGTMSMQMIPNGCIELIIHLNDWHCALNKDDVWAKTPDYMVLGLYTKPYEVQFKSLVKVFAIRFKPEGLYNVFGLPAGLIKDSFEDMELILGYKFRDFCHRIKETKCVRNMVEYTEHYLLHCLNGHNIDPNYVNLAADLIRKTKGIRIEDLPDKVFISQRQLEREFKEKLGISPKHYLRITRINEVMRLLNNSHEIDLTSVAYYCGYFDQSHFINDFKSITGKNPSIFIKNRKEIIANPGLAHYER
ncbi:AraC family transcriptional regulator [Flavobacteriaceae bacterium MAR_2010_72]|nr:AraC family transcriptional regulator [Flavobacteriaceae bacterium MAR_2010_72]TVZ60057.1 AraC-like DNA-binding protein [Flavobacteriaceae bacterium MAR_2010_105]